MELSLEDLEVIRNGGVSPFSWDDLAQRLDDEIDRLIAEDDCVVAVKASEVTAGTKVLRPFKGVVREVVGPYIIINYTLQVEGTSPMQWHTDANAELLAQREEA